MFPFHETNVSIHEKMITMADRLQDPISLKIGHISWDSQASGRSVQVRDMSVRACRGSATSYRAHRGPISQGLLRTREARRKSPQKRPTRRFAGPLQTLALMFASRFAGIAAGLKICGPAWARGEKICGPSVDPQRARSRPVAWARRGPACVYLIVDSLSNN